MKFGAVTNYGTDLIIATRQCSDWSVPLWSDRKAEEMERLHKTLLEGRIINSRPRPGCHRPREGADSRHRNPFCPGDRKLGAWWPG